MLTRGEWFAISMLALPNQHAEAWQVFNLMLDAFIIR